MSMLEVTKLQKWRYLDQIKQTLQYDLLQVQKQQYDLEYKMKSIINQIHMIDKQILDFKEGKVVMPPPMPMRREIIIPTHQSPNQTQYISHRHKDYVCNKCKLMFQNKKFLKVHLSEVHSY